MVDEKSGRTIRKKSAKLPLQKKNYIREWREFRGYGSQGDLAKACGFERATISRLEAGKLQYRQWHLDKLALVLRCEPGDLLSVDPFDNASIIQIYNSLSERRKRAALRAVKKIAGQED